MKKSHYSKNLRPSNVITLGLVKQLLKRIEDLFVEISINPRTGRGKPERLKGYKDKEVWSRRLNGKDRIVYQIKDDVLEVLMLSLFGHYD